jgi:hypothetical protein
MNICVYVRVSKKKSFKNKQTMNEEYDGQYILYIFGKKSNN